MSQIISIHQDEAGNVLTPEQVYGEQVLVARETLVMNEDQYLIAMDMVAYAWESKDWDQWIDVRIALFF